MESAGFGVGANLDGIFSASKGFFDAIIFSAEFFEAFHDKVSMVETAFANVARNGWERNEGDWTVDKGKSLVEKLGEGFCESADGVVF